MTQAPHWAVEPVRHGDAAAREVVAGLHRQLLDFGPMARLGTRFLRDFCYGTLLRDGLLAAAIGRVDGVPAGFVAWTSRAVSFHASALGRHPVAVPLFALRSVLGEKRPVARIAEAVRLTLARGSERLHGEDPMAEVLAIGVLPEFASPAFVRQSGLRVSELLVRHCAEEFMRQGFGSMRMIVDADNRAAILFYHVLGARIRPYEKAQRPSVEVRFDVRELATVAPSGDGAGR